MALLDLGWKYSLFIQRLVATYVRSAQEDSIQIYGSMDRGPGKQLWKEHSPCINLGSNRRNRMDITLKEHLDNIRKIKTPKRDDASRKNGKLGGRPKGSKNKPKEPRITEVRE